MKRELISSTFIVFVSFFSYLIMTLAIMMMMMMVRKKNTAVPQQFEMTKKNNIYLINIVLKVKKEQN